VSLDDRSVTLTRAGSPVATWGLRAPCVPRIVLFTGHDDLTVADAARP